MSEPNCEAIDRALDVLNEMLALDPIATNALFCASAPVNEALANHPTIQVWAPPGQQTCVRPIGLINGLFGCDGNEIGYICADYDNGRITGFRRTPLPETKPAEEAA